MDVCSDPTLWAPFSADHSYISVYCLSMYRVITLSLIEHHFSAILRITAGIPELVNAKKSKSVISQGDLMLKDIHPLSHLFDDCIFQIKLIRFQGPSDFHGIIPDNAFYRLTIPSFKHFVVNLWLFT